MKTQFLSIIAIIGLMSSGVAQDAPKKFQTRSDIEKSKKLFNENQPQTTTPINSNASSRSIATSNQKQKLQLKPLTGEDAKKVQGKKVLSLRESVLEQSKKLAPSRLKQLQWINEDEYLYVDGKSLMFSGLSDSSKVNEKVTDALKATVKANQTDASKKVSLPRLKRLKSGKFVFHLNHKLFELDYAAAKIVEQYAYHKDAGNKDLSEANYNMAYTRDGGLYINVDGQEVIIAQSEEDGIVYGQAVHRYEFGIHKGTFWSPAGDQLAFYRKDERKVTEYPIVNITTTPASMNAVRYPMAGQQSHYVTLGVYNVASKETVYLKTGEEKDHYLTNVAWGPKGEYIYIALVNRDQNEMKLNQYKAATGALVKTLFTETHEKYVEPEHPMEFIPGRDDEFLWRSERDGFEHVYRYNTDGKLLKQITKGNWQVKEVVGWDHTRTKLIVVGTDESGLNQYIYKTDIFKGKVQRLSEVDGVHRAKVSPSGKYILDTYTSLTIPRMSEVIDWDGKVVKRVHKSENPLADYYQAQTELVTLKADDGTPLYGRMIKPTDFKENRKYPVVVYLYGGPHLQLVQNRWNAGASLWMHYLANQGYLVFTMDTRGSDNRGRDFEQATFRQLGTKEIEDQLVGVEYLKSLPYVNQARLGIHGWSFGGFMTTNMMLRAPGNFQVGVAGGPVIDWKWYEVMYTERYMDMPEQNEEGYAKADLKKYVKNLKGKLLMIHGAVDDVVVWQHSMAFAKQCVDDGVQIDYFMYPEHPHNVLGKDRVHLMNKVIDYFKLHL